MLPRGEESPAAAGGEASGEPRGEPPRKSMPRGVASAPSVGSVGVDPRTTARLGEPQEGQKRAAPGTSLPQAEQVIAVAEVYHCPIPTSDSVERSLLNKPVRNSLGTDSKRGALRT